MEVAAPPADAYGCASVRGDVIRVLVSHLSATGRLSIFACCLPAASEQSSSTQLPDQYWLCGSIDSSWIAWLASPRPQSVGSFAPNIIELLSSTEKVPSSAPTSTPSHPPTAALHSVPPSYLRTSAEQSATASLSRLLPSLYGLSGEEHGHRTVGHSCVSREEMAAAAQNHHDLLYGEVLPVGATKLFDQEHLALADARSLCDLGSGLGKLALQAFLQFPNLRRVFGCELSASRFRKSRGAVQQLKKLQQHCRAKLVAQGRGGQLVAGAGSDESDEEEEESKCERRESLPDALALPHLSLHLERDSESGDVSMVRYEETLPRASSRVHPLWGSLPLLESCCAEAGVGAGVITSDSDVDASDSTSGSEGEGSSFMDPASSPALSSSGVSAGSASSASPPALHLSSARGLTRSLEFRCLNLFHLEEALLYAAP